MNRLSKPPGYVQWLPIAAVVLCGLLYARWQHGERYDDQKALCEVGTAAVTFWDRRSTIEEDAGRRGYRTTPDWRKLALLDREFEDEVAMRYQPICKRPVRPDEKLFPLPR